MNANLSFRSSVLILIVCLAGMFIVIKDGYLLNKISYVKIGDVNVQVELATTPQARAQGLSGRAGLSEDEGMLFIFDKSGRYSFWMKDMNFAIDIIWISDDMRVVYIKKDARPESYPESFMPETSALYVLEVNAGYAKQHDLKEGDAARFDLP